MKDLGSVSHNSILRNSDSAIKDFHWEIVSNELVEKIPTLISIYHS